MERLFDNKDKKIIIGSSLKEIDSVIKAYVMKYKKAIINFEKATVSSLATMMISENKKFDEYEMIDNDESNLLFYSFLSEHIENEMIFDIIPEKSFSYATAKNAYEAINKIRKGRIKKENNEYGEIASSFETYLNENKLLDEPLILKKAIEIESECDKNIKMFLLPSLKNKLSYLENEFLRKFMNVEDFDKSYLVYYQKEKEQYVKRVKTPTYGYSNEIKYVINEIKNNKYNLNDVAVYTPSDAYDGMLKSYFENSDINYRFASEKTVACEDFTGFFISIIDFLKDHFNIKYLYSLYKNPALGFYKDSSGKDHSYSCISRLKDLRADKEQLENEVGKWPSEERKSFVLDLIKVYDKNDSTLETYKKALAFTLKYTNSLSHRYVKDAFVQKERLFSRLDDSKMSYPEKLDFIKEYIPSIKITKELKKDENCYVLIDSLNSKFLDRKYNFFIGLSANEININEIESPFISDEMFKDILDCDHYYVQLAKNMNKEFNSDLLYLVSTQIRGKQYFITSEYDSVDFKPLAKSAFYLSTDANAEETYYLIEDIKMKNENDDVNEFLYPQTEENINKVSNKNLSPSAIGEMMLCPLKHIYRLIYDDIELDEFEGKWLKGGDTGTFAHALLEKYFSDVKIECFDNSLFEECYLKTYEEMKEKLPYSIEAIQDVEANRVKIMVEKYLDRYYENVDQYKPIYCELDIKKDTNNCKYPDITSEYQIHGIVDRIDAYVNENGDLKVRIIDYKTTKDNPDVKNASDKLTQVVLYPHLVNDFIKNHIKEIEDKVGKKFNNKEQYDISFIYEFLKLGKKYELLEYYDLIKDTIDNSLKNYDLLMKEPTWNKFVEIYAPFIEQNKEHDHGKCGYCTYSNFCRLKIMKGDNVIWKK